MARVTDIVSRSREKPVFMCDFSSPRDPTADWLGEARNLNADLFCVPHLAPHPTRPDAITAAHLIRDNVGTEVVFNLAARDASKSEVRDRLNNARRLGLENVVVLQGDANRGVADAAGTDRFKPTELIAELKGLGGDFCVGAVADLANGVEKEADLCRLKVDAGADFFLVQPTFDIEAVERFLANPGLAVPMFFGVQVLARGGIAFAPVPEPLRLQIERGRSGADAAEETMRRFLRLGVYNFYLIAPIYPGGARDYGLARQVIDSFEHGAGSAPSV